MGWGNGVYVAEDIWVSIKKYVPEKYKQKVARIIVESVEAHDCDTIQDSEILTKACKFKECTECGYRLKDKSKTKLCEDCSEANSEYLEDALGYDE